MGTLFHPHTLLITVTVVYKSQAGSAAVVLVGTALMLAWSPKSGVFLCQVDVIYEGA